jgi:hypothetical protein
MREFLGAGGICVFLVIVPLSEEAIFEKKVDGN